MIVAAAVCAVMQFALFFWMITLVWKTFLFRFTFMYRLFIREFPMLWFVLLHFVIVLGEKGYRFVSDILLLTLPQLLYATKAADPVTIYD